MPSGRLIGAWDPAPRTLFIPSTSIWAAGTSQDRLLRFLGQCLIATEDQAQASPLPDDDGELPF
jgi:hypothetical protein